MSAIFISHSSRDNDAAATLREKLQEQGHRSVFLDFDPADGIPAGRDWERELYLQIRSCRVVIVLCSQASMASRWCFMEITHARALGKPLFPIRLDDCDLDGVLTDRQVLQWDQADVWPRLFRGLEVAGLDADDPFDWDNSRPPYPGLLSFQEADAAVFFGRDAQIGEGLDLLNRVVRLGDARMVVVLGASGSGKSSLVRAGLLPRLRRDVGRWWIAGPLRPGHAPLRQLSLAVAAMLTEQHRPRSAAAILQELEQWTPEGAAPALSAPEREALRDLLEQGERLALDSAQHDLQASLRRLRRSLAPRPASAPDQSTPLQALVDELRQATGHLDGRLLIVVDQFEELLDPDAEGQTEQTLRLLRAATDDPSGRVVVLATLRSDFLGSLQASESLRDLPMESLSLGPLSTQGLVQTIEGPAELASLDLEPGLVQVLTQDSRGPDALPLMAFALRELYDRCGQDGRLTVSDYRDRLGGVRGAVARAAADAVDLAALEPEQRDAVRRAFLALVRVGESGRFARRVARWDALPAAAQPLLTRYVDARLLVSRVDDQGGRRIEVAHEALFESWPVLVGWLRDSAEALRLQGQLDRDAAAWVDAERAPDFLWHGVRVQRAGALVSAGAVHLSDDVRAFLSESTRAENAARDKRRKLRNVVSIVVSALGVISLGFMVYALHERGLAQDEALRSQAQERKAAVRVTAGRALEELREGDRLRAVQLARAAAREDPGAFELRMLMATAVDRPWQARLLADPSDEVAVSVQGAWVVRPPGNQGGGMLIHRDGLAIDVGDAAPVVPAAGDRALLVQGATSRWQPLDGSASEPASLGAVSAAAWSPDGTQLLVCVNGQGTEPDTVSLLDAQGQTVRALSLSVQCGAGWPARVWSPDGATLLVPDPWSEGVQRVPVDGSAAPTLLPVGADPDWSWSPTGDVVVWSTAGGQAALYDAQGGFVSSVDVPQRVDWAPDGACAALVPPSLQASSPDNPGPVTVLDNLGQSLATLGSADDVWLGWSPGGTWLAMAHAGRGLALHADPAADEPARIIELPAGTIDLVAGAWSSDTLLWLVTDSGALLRVDVARPVDPVRVFMDHVYDVRAAHGLLLVRTLKGGWALYDTAPTPVDAQIRIGSEPVCVGEWCGVPDPEQSGLLLMAKGADVELMNTQTRESTPLHGLHGDAFVWRSDGQWFASCGMEGAQVWSMGEDEPERVGRVSRPVPLGGHPGRWLYSGCSVEWDTQRDHFVVHWVEGRLLGWTPPEYWTQLPDPAYLEHVMRRVADGDHVTSREFRTFDQFIPGTVDALLAEAERIAPGEAPADLLPWKLDPGDQQP
jgi:ABC-type hemin transport system ATPase subunit